MAVVASEVRGLLAAFEANRSFRTSAGHLLEMIECSSYVSSPSLPPPDPLTLTPTFETPLIIRIALGRFVANGQPIPSEWALSLLRTLLANQAKPMTRCRPEFDALFQLLYRERFGAGIVVRPPTERITVSYRPASSGLRGPITKTLDDIPDVAPLEELRKPLREIGSACSEQLDAYSRYLGRNPEARGSLRAAALLPAELLLSQGGAAVNRLREWILGTVASEQPVIVPVDDLIANWAPGRKRRSYRKPRLSLSPRPSRPSESGLSLMFDLAARLPSKARSSLPSALRLRPRPRLLPSTPPRLSSCISARSSQRLTAW